MKKYFYLKKFYIFFFKPKQQNIILYFENKQMPQYFLNCNVFEFKNFLKLLMQCGQKTKISCLWFYVIEHFFKFLKQKNKTSFFFFPRDLIEFLKTHNFFLNICSMFFCFKNFFFPVFFYILKKKNKTFKKPIVSFISLKIIYLVKQKRICFFLRWILRFFVNLRKKSTKHALFCLFVDLLANYKKSFYYSYKISIYKKLLNL